MTIPGGNDTSQGRDDTHDAQGRPSPLSPANNNCRPIKLIDCAVCRWPQRCVRESRRVDLQARRRSLSLSPCLTPPPSLPHYTRVVRVAERKPRRVDYDPRAKFRTHRHPRTGRCRASRPTLVMQIANMVPHGGARCQVQPPRAPSNRARRTITRIRFFRRWRKQKSRAERSQIARVAEADPSTLGRREETAEIRANVRARKDRFCVYAGGSFVKHGNHGTDRQTHTHIHVACTRKRSDRRPDS